MRITYDELTMRYVATDARGNWYPQSHTMIGAIQNALSVIYYYQKINAK